MAVDALGDEQRRATRAVAHLGYADEGRRQRTLALERRIKFLEARIQELEVDLAGVTVLELTIIPDQGRGLAHASLAEWRLA